MNLSARNLHKTYGPHTALQGFNLEVKGARCIAFIGPSGGGKSTALRLLSGLESPDCGQITVENRTLNTIESELLEYRKTIGVVFQSYNLFPHLSVLENITLPLTEVHQQPLAQAQDRAYSLLKRFQLENHALKKPTALSGGQAQRVAIVRALAPCPKLLFFDEPTSALDPEMTAEILDTIKELIETGTNVLTVTHQMGFAKQVSDQVAFISQGSVIEHAPAQQLFDSPQTNETQNFLSKVLKY